LKKNLTRKGQDDLKTHKQW